ncbi:MAG: hypothetical protein V1872_05210 [bacterium]
MNKVSDIETDPRKIANHLLDIGEYTNLIDLAREKLSDLDNLDWSYQWWAFLARALINLGRSEEAREPLARTLLGSHFDEDFTDILPLMIDFYDALGEYKKADIVYAYSLYNFKWLRYSCGVKKREYNGKPNPKIEFTQLYDQLLSLVWNPTEFSETELISLMVEFEESYLSKRVLRKKSEQLVIECQRR